MSVETNPHNYTNINLIFSQFLPVRNSPKENSGASGGFLLKPLLLRLRQPNSKKISRVFCEILSPKNSFAKTSSALFRHLPEYLEGRTTKEKRPFHFRKNHPRENQKKQGVFFLSGLLAYSPVRGAFSERTLQFRFTTHAERATSFVLEIGASSVQ